MWYLRNAFRQLLQSVFHDHRSKVKESIGVSLAAAYGWVEWLTFPKPRSLTQWQVKLHWRFALQGCGAWQKWPEFVLSIPIWRRFLNFVLQICRTHELYFTLTLKVSYRHIWQKPTGHLEWRGFFPQGTAGSAVTWIRKDKKELQIFGLLVCPVRWSALGLGRSKYPEALSFFLIQDPFSFSQRFQLLIAFFSRWIMRLQQCESGWPYMAVESTT